MYDCATAIIKAWEAKQGDPERGLLLFGGAMGNRPSHELVILKNHPGVYLF